MYIMIDSFPALPLVPNVTLLGKLQALVTRYLYIFFVVAEAS